MEESGRLIQDNKLRILRCDKADTGAVYICSYFIVFKT